ncbi:protein of unknown function [Candidatus Nitrosacidococcus tergens]|uniref:Uncharacterized protein n=1 Tax=Candidatus Nitrosacidococcus tergens TaxID=553981 RepID=A0A7G1QB20_9GAMM|nr:protein of unknown function [Candidatus Nitrosacidococcus tergens]
MVVAPTGPELDYQLFGTSVFLHPRSSAQNETGRSDPIGSDTQHRHSEMLQEQSVSQWRDPRCGSN